MKSFQERPHCPLPFAADLFELHACDHRVLKIADQQLAFEGSKPVIGDFAHTAGGSRELVWEPHRRLVEILSSGIQLFRCRLRGRVPVKTTILYVTQLARADPCALIVRHENILVRSKCADAIRLTKSTGERFRLLAAWLGSQCPTHVTNVPMSGMPSIGYDKIPRLIKNWAIRKRVIAAGVTPITRNCFKQVCFAILIGVGKTRDLRLVT